MSDYERPRIEAVEFRDEAGNIIDYGNRWTANDESPPADSYSVVEHPQRFAPLHRVAVALIDHLTATYRVDLDEGSHVATTLWEGPSPKSVARAVRLTPRDPACAPVTFVLTTFPGTELYAGEFFNESFPACGCSACDDSWEPLAAELEWQTQAIVGGNLTEVVHRAHLPQLRYTRGLGTTVAGAGPWVRHDIEALDGSRKRGGEHQLRNLPRERLRAAQHRLAQVEAADGGGRWRAWPRRVDAITPPGPGARG